MLNVDMGGMIFSALTSVDNSGGGCMLIFSCSQIQKTIELKKIGQNANL